MDFTAIDFETANSSRSSACALGLVQVRAGVVTAEHAWLIDPQQRFDGMNIAIHGITPSMVQGKPTFRELWPTVEPLLQGEIVIAHNASFDMSVLRYCLDDSSLSYPDFQYLCTYLLGKKMLQELPSHKLNVISEHFGIRLKHHDALDDARASALILLKLMEQWQQFDPLLLAGDQGYKAGTLYAGGYTPFKAAPKKPAKKPAALKAAAPAAEAKAKAAREMPELVRGQRVDIGERLSASRLLFAIEWDAPSPGLELDVSAFLLRDTGRCEQEQEFVFYGNMEDPGGCVLYAKPAPDAGLLILQLSRLPAAIERVAVTLTIFGDVSGRSLGQLGHAAAFLIDPASGKKLAGFPFAQGLTLETAVVIGEFYRYKEKWRFAAISEGFSGGLHALCTRYGLEVESSGPAAGSAAESAAAAEAAVVRSAEGPDE
ncbi:TerD family protein [Paenibacillus sp. MMS20-IR301]|uniref:TerD family protein n=1 Tax=Paenibacillus sp. MMS20-IR301 TaxID=2895946 RepID=UPI0028E39781|nr:TerD family protein [Paenibacillus sp. MMS20-IR301]WNS40875.1 TerD family protein [Paenibacillus sp. MMS20-IR301]